MNTNQLNLNFRLRLLWWVVKTCALSNRLRGNPTSLLIWECQAFNGLILGKLCESPAKSKRTLYNAWPANSRSIQPVRGKGYRISSSSGRFAFTARVIHRLYNSFKGHINSSQQGQAFVAKNAPCI